MKRLVVLLLAVMAVSGFARGQKIPVEACQSSKGRNVFVTLDSRPTPFSRGSETVSFAPTISLALVSRLESILKTQGFCVYHWDEFDAAGNLSRGAFNRGDSPQQAITILALVEEVKESGSHTELLVYRVETDGRWVTVPELAWMSLNKDSDIEGRAYKMSGLFHATE